VSSSQREIHQLTRKVQAFLRTDVNAAKHLRQLADGTWRTFLFGGTIREILLMRHQPEIRDLDIVIDDAGFAAFQRRFKDQIIGVNRFGGLRLVLQTTPVDAWALSSTWAFRSGHVSGMSRAQLPQTTFLNLDSIVFEITPGRIRNRLLAEPFVRALRNNVLDIVLSENPEPELAAVRSIRMHFRYNIPVSRRLAEYLVTYLENSGIEGCLREQIRHYNRILVDRERVEGFWADLREFLESRRQASFPHRMQLHLFEQAAAPVVGKAHRYRKQNCQTVSN
jgi:hypothetical protein